MKSILRALARHARKLLHVQISIREEYLRARASVAALMPGNPAAYGYKVYSQCDEDGIIAHVFSKIGEGQRLFVEIGCSDGLENNTHTLALKGWKGVWIDADRKKISRVSAALPPNNRLIVIQAFVSTSNAVELLRKALGRLNADVPDFLSIDIDSDDLNVLSAILMKIQPRLVCAEYNAKFPPPIVVSASGNGTWAGDDYQGASLTAFVQRMREHGYVLIACGVSGVNAFFVKEADSAFFPAFTIEELYQPARFDLCRMDSGHLPSLKFLAARLAED